MIPVKIVYFQPKIISDTMCAKPVVSVVIPAYNASRWIGDTIISAQRQTLRDIEIIIVDDGSHDDTAGIVERHASHDPRIRLVSIRNRGVGAARNTGIQHAKGEFIAPLDADDLWEPDKLEKQVCRIKQSGTKTAMIYCWSRQIDEDGNSSFCYPPITVEGHLLSALILRNFLGNASVPLFRAEVLVCSGLYLTRDEQGGVQGCEDWDLSIRIAEQWHVGLVPEVLVSYRQVGSCMSAGTAGMSASYRLVMERVRQRNHHLPEALFRWSEGHFQSYLGSKSYACRDFRGCLAAARRAITADPAIALNGRLHNLTIRSFIWLAFGNWLVNALKRGKKDFEISFITPSLSAGVSWFERIQERRWKQVVEGKVK